MRKCEWCGNIIVVEESMSKIYLKECRGDKENCLKQFYTHQPNKQYCDSRCRYNSILESNRKSRKKYYQNNKKKSILSQLGTTTLSKHPNPDFEREKEIIKNEKKRTFHTTIYKGKKTNNNVWIDNCKTLEYGEPQPTGIQNTHNYATLDDYYHTAKYYLLKDKGTCPLCGCKDHYKTDIDVSCAECGLILESNTNLMGATDVDVVDSENTKERKNIDCPNCDKEITVILNSKSVLKDRYVKCKYCGFIIQYELKDDLLKIVGAFSTVQDIAWKKYRQGK